MRDIKGHTMAWLTRNSLPPNREQRATQAYIWALPIVAFNEWQKANRNVFGASDTDFVIYRRYQDKLGILTANATTPYIISFLASKRPDLS